MHVELYKIFVFWNMRCLSVSIRSMHVELYKFFVFWNIFVFWNMRYALSVCEY